MSDYGKIRSVKVTTLSTTAYCCITTDKRSLDVKLSPGMSSGASLRQTSQELREKAQKLLDRADLIDFAEKVFI